MLTPHDATTFEQARPNLLGLAYRILGSLADAEDAVQDTFVKWAQADRGEIENPGSFLTTVCTRRCLDLLRAANRTRVDYIGTWLPEPIQKTVDDGTEDSLELAGSLKTAFLLMLERLSPKERAAYLLHDIFDMSYRDTADTLEIAEPACRKLVSRANRHLGQTKVRYRTSGQRQDELLHAFQNAVTNGVTAELTRLLSADVRLCTDGGGKVPALLVDLTGSKEVTTFLTERLRDYWRDHAWHFVDINGERGAVIRHHGEITASVSFAYDETDRVTDIYIVRNPEKLARLGTIDIH